MFDFFWNLASFIVLLGILVAVHEWGHFYVARKCGVFVTRFSIGFGKPIWRKLSKSGTEYVIAAIPLGGYVRMLDGRIDDVPSSQLDQTFDNKSVYQRMAIIAAGPGINFIFAIFVLYFMFLIGVQSVKPVVGDILPDSIAAQAELQPNEEIISINNHNIKDWNSVNLELVASIGDDHLLVQTTRKEYQLNLQNWNFDPEKDSSLRSLGIVPYSPKAHTEIAQVAPDSPAAKAGILQGDVLIALNDDKIARWQDWVTALSAKPGETITVLLQRDGRLNTLSVTLDSIEVSSGVRGYLGVGPKTDPWPEDMLFTDRYGIIDSAGAAILKTWRLMTFSLDMIGKVILGDVSVKNLSGPISIAQGAGTSADFGLVYFLGFMALISVNLGIVNLLPLPMLDGGHLMYFIVEWIRGRPVSDEVQEIGFRIGAAILFTLMGIAIFNDIARLS